MTHQRRKWAVSANQYVQQPGTGAPGSPASGVRPSQTSTEGQQRLEYLGVSWQSFGVDAIKPSGVERARARFRAHLPDLIWNTAALEGNNFTLPEVRTLLEGSTVGGKKVEDEQQILALSEAYSRLDEMVGARQFSLDRQVSDELHFLIAQHEAREAGHFRGEGSATGGGNVILSNGGTVPGVEHGPGGELLRARYRDMLDGLAEFHDPRMRALVYFCSATRRQLYFDGNKRTARLMMTGELMSQGFDIVSVPVARRLEFNTALDELFMTDDATPLLRFLATCTID